MHVRSVDPQRLLLHEAGRRRGRLLVGDVRPGRVQHRLHGGQRLRSRRLRRLVLHRDGRHGGTGHVLRRQRRGGLPHIGRVQLHRHGNRWNRLRYRQLGGSQHFLRRAERLPAGLGLLRRTGQRRPELRDAAAARRDRVWVCLARSQCVRASGRSRMRSGQPDLELPCEPVLQRIPYGTVRLHL